MAITSFTQDDINNNRLVYVHDGTNTTSDSFAFDVDDGQGNAVTAQTFNLTVTPVDDDAPVQTTNTGSTVVEAGTDTIIGGELLYTDSEQPATSVTYTVTGGLANGQLELTTGPGVAITSFTQDDINNNRLVYVHDGTNTTSDSFAFDVDDGQGNAVTAQTFNLTDHAGRRRRPGPDDQHRQHGGRGGHGYDYQRRAALHRQRTASHQCHLHGHWRPGQWPAGTNDWSGCGHHQLHAGRHQQQPAGLCARRHQHHQRQFCL